MDGQVLFSTIWNRVQASSLFTVSGEAYPCPIGKII